MTAEVAVLNKSAVALAADSKVSVRISGTLKTHDTANKLFTLSKYHPVGVMINGNAEFMEIPWETIIKIYRDKLRERCVGALEAYAEDFISSLTTDYPNPDSVQKNNFLFIVLDFLSNISDRVQTLIARGQHIEEARLRALEAWQRRVEGRPELQSMSGVTAEEILKLYKAEMLEAIKLIFPEASDEYTEGLLKFLTDAIRKDIFSEGCSEVIVSGFGDEEIFPALKAYKIDGVVAGKLRYKVTVEKRSMSVVRGLQRLSIPSLRERWLTASCWESTRITIAI